jgi:hypothetical protein
VFGRSLTSLARPKQVTLLHPHPPDIKTLKTVGFNSCPSIVIMAASAKPTSVITKLNGPLLKERRHSKSQSAFNYDNTSSNLAATTMLNELKKLVESAPPESREVSDCPQC